MPQNYINQKSDPPEVNDNYTRDFESDKTWPQASWDIYVSVGR